MYCDPGMTRKGGKEKVLLTGAVGKIGSAFFSYARGDYDFRLLDRSNVVLDVGVGDHSTFNCDVSDAAACKVACEGIDVVVHLAADPSPDADFEGSLLSNNIVGVRNILEAAKVSGCRRVVLASSVQAVEGYPLDVQVREGMSVRPKNLYGVSKCFLEALASYYATEEGLSCIAVRVGAFEYTEGVKSMSARDMSAFVSPRDLCQLLVGCIEAPDDLKFAVAAGISDNRFKRMDLTSTREVFGYEPQDDAFRLMKVLTELS